MSDVAAARLPAPRTPGEYAVAFVCTGNICRSPSADVVLTAMLSGTDLAERVQVASCGIGGWHIGEEIDARAGQHLSRRGYDPSRHRAQQIDDGWLERYDVLFAMDAGHLSELNGLGESREDGAREEDRVRLFRDFDPIGTGQDTPDPYYGGDDGFAEVLAMVERTCQQILPAIRRALGGGADRS